MGSLVAELAEKLSSATNSLDFDEQTLYINTSTNKVAIGTNAPVTDLTIEGPITIKEQADADSDTAAYGQIWVNTATPNELYFTTDAGNDIQLTTGTRLAATPADGAQTFNDTGAAVDFRIESDDDQYMFFVDGSEDKIGIGTSAPGAMLHITENTDANSTQTVLKLSRTYASSNFTDEVGGAIVFSLHDSSQIDADVAKITWGEMPGGGDNDDYLAFNTLDGGSMTETMRVTDSKVGIGTTTPSSTLAVAGTGGTTVSAIENYGTTAAQGAQLNLSRSNNGTLGTQTAVDADDLLGEISYQGSSGSAFVSGARIAGYADETHSGTAAGSTLRFYTADNTTTTLDERVRIDHNGKVGIGIANPTSELHVNGAITSNDLILNNLEKDEPNMFDGTKGHWHIQEGADNLFIMNHVTGKKYKFNLTEIS